MKSNKCSIKLLCKSSRSGILLPEHQFAFCKLIRSAEKMRSRGTGFGTTENLLR